MPWTEPSATISSLCRLGWSWYFTFRPFIDLKLVQVENAKGLSQINLLMNLRKICNHPFLLGDLKDKQGRNIREYNVKLLAMASGKVLAWIDTFMLACGMCKQSLTFIVQASGPHAPSVEKGRAQGAHILPDDEAA